MLLGGSLDSVTIAEPMPPLKPHDGADRGLRLAPERDVDELRGILRRVESSGTPRRDLARRVGLPLARVSLLLIGIFVSQSTHMRLERERQIERGRDSIEDLNEQLQRRLAELNAVSEITEVVHSSLEFDVIGPLVIEIVRKVIGVSACSLLVLDKERAETLFSASAGVVPAVSQLTMASGPAVRAMLPSPFSAHFSVFVPDGGQLENDIQPRPAPPAGCS
jgi:hypothetical protein